MTRTRTITAGLAGLALAAALAVTGCGSSAPATVTVRGSFSTGPLSGTQCVSGGDQVTITDAASGRLLATAVLPVSPVIKSVDGLIEETYPYTATVPAVTRYGVTVGDVPPYYVSQAEFTAQGADLSC